MGSGKAKYANLNSGVSSEASLDQDSYDSLTKSVDNHLDGLSGDEIDQSLISELKDKYGIEVEFSSAESAKKTIQDIMGEVDLDSLSSIYSTYGSLSLAMSMYRDGEGSFNASQKKILDLYWDLDLGGRTASSLDKAIQNYASVKNNSSSVPNSPAITKGKNSALSTTATLSSIANSLGIKPLKSLVFASDSPDALKGVAGQYATGLNSISIMRFDPTRADTSTGFNVGGSHVRSYVAHEFGHHIENTVFKYKSQIQGSSAVSTYGNANSHEAFAESFSAYCLGVTPIRGTEYHNNFKSLMKSSGLSAFEGCLK